jgi:hypothetical protein
MKTDPCRFCRLYALALPPIAVILGVLLTWQASLLAQPQLLARGVYTSGALAPGGLLLSLLRSVAPAANGSALLVALVLWADPLPAAQLQRELPAILKRVGFVCLPGFTVAALLSWAAAWALGVSWLELPARSLSASLLSRADVGFALLASLVDAALIAFAAWRGLPRLQAARFSLPAKLVLSWTVLFPVRAMLGLVLESVLPG